MAPILALMFDFGGVLVRTLDRRPRQTWEERLGLAPGSLERLVFGCETSRRASVGQATSDEVWEAVYAGLHVEGADRGRLRQDFFAGDRLDRRLLTYLRRQRPGRRTALITNAWGDARRAFDERWHILDAFDQIVISAEEGVMKPDLRIYRLALERLAVPPEQAVFVDDFEENVAAARWIGIHAVHFRSADQALHDVEDLLGSSA